MARLFSLGYATRPDVSRRREEAYLRFFSENALNPMAVPDLRAMETEVVSMTRRARSHAPDRLPRE